MSLAQPYHNKIGTQIRLETYVRFESPSIIHYFEQLDEDMFNERFADYRFDETIL